MRRTIRWLLVVCVALSGNAVPAAAEAISPLFKNRFSRWTGYGWSEGYHSNDECPQFCHQMPLYVLPAQPQPRPVPIDSQPQWDNAGFLGTPPARSARSVVKPPPTAANQAKLRPRDLVVPPPPIPRADAPISAPPTTTSALRPRELMPVSAVEAVVPFSQPGRYPLAR